MRKVDNNLVFSPSDLITFMDSSFDSWMERCYLEFPGEYQVDDVDESVAILQEHGNQHELAFLDKLKETCGDVVEISGRDELAELGTIAAMQAGHSVIYQGVLAAGEFAGRSDFLVRVPGKSKLGDYHYEVWDTKLSKKAKPYFVVQLCCYAEMLERVQGRCPEKIKIVLGDSSEKEFVTRDYIHFYFQLKKSFLEFQKNFSKDAPPDDIVVSTYSRWKTIAEEKLEERDDLIRVANIRKTQIQRLQNGGIATLKKLSLAVAADVPAVPVTVFETLQTQASLQIQTVAEEKVAYKILPSEKGKGLSLLPPASPNDIFFDMEGYPHVEGGLEYLFGIVEKSGDEIVFRDWWAHDRDTEKRAFEEFIDYVYARWLSDRSLHIYHYAPYEVSALRRLAGRHSTRVEEVDSLLTNEIFVDLYQIVRQAFLVGVPSYSIKYIEHLYRPKRTGTVAKAMDSVVFYERWIQNPDGQSWQESPLLKDIRDYNEADCLSTEQLAQWLWAQQSSNGIGYTGKVSETPVEIIKSPAAILADELLAGAEHIDDPEKRRVQQLLAHLLEFHKRENKPLWWRRFDRQKKSDPELFDDLDCLTGLKRTGRPPYEIKSSLAYEYQFDPDQDTKLDDGDTCLFLHDLMTTRIESFDRRNGFVSVVLGKQKQPPLDQITLIPDEMIKTRTLSDAIFQIALNWSESKTLPKALGNFLFRLAPDIKNKSNGAELVRSSEIEDIVPVIEAMNETTLCIQGPPGCGKTYVATHSIVKLLQEGKRIAIASNSHKAIEHLLEAVVNEAKKSDVQVRAMKVGGPMPGCVDVESVSGKRKNPKGADENIQRPRQSVEHIGAAKQFFENDSNHSYNLVAGTAWCFCHQHAESKFDYLFVEEAGQVCLANVVGMSRCARNLILLGDQMQLEQPIEGTHPGESGQSSLEYYLQNHATIPSTLGIFLGTTRRMHPDVCDLISFAVYESRIKSDPSTAQQVLSFPDNIVSGRIGKRSGIVWVPVQHQGNAQASDEEVEAIDSLVKDLLLCHYTNNKGATKPVTLNDILIVAPFNMQVRKIAHRIPGALVASVDKFQGREAPIVILSMSASEASSSPRGMDFLFSISRLNVAISRAQTIAFVVGNPNLSTTTCTTLNQMRLLNFFCQIVDAGNLGNVGTDSTVITAEADRLSVQI